MKFQLVPQTARLGVVGGTPMDYHSVGVGVKMATQRFNSMSSQTMNVSLQTVAQALFLCLNQNLLSSLRLRMHLSPTLCLRLGEGHFVKSSAYKDSHFLSCILNSLMNTIRSVSEIK